MLLDACKPHLIRSALDPAGYYTPDQQAKICDAIERLLGRLQAMALVEPTRRLEMLGIISNWRAQHDQEIQGGIPSYHVSHGVAAEEEELLLLGAGMKRKREEVERKKEVEDDDYIYGPDRQRSPTLT